MNHFLNMIETKIRLRRKSFEDLGRVYRYRMTSNLYICNHANATTSDIWRHFVLLNSYPVFSSLRVDRCIYDMHYCNVFNGPNSWLVVSDVTSVNMSLATNQPLGPWCDVRRHWMLHITNTTLLTSRFSADMLLNSFGINMRSPLRPSLIALFMMSMLALMPRTTAHRLIRLSARIDRASKLIAAALEPV